MRMSHCLPSLATPHRHHVEFDDDGEVTGATLAVQGAVGAGVAHHRARRCGEWQLAEVHEHELGSRAGRLGDRVAEVGQLVAAAAQVHARPRPGDRRAGALDGGGEGLDAVHRHQLRHRGAARQRLEVASHRLDASREVLLEPSQERVRRHGAVASGVVAGSHRSAALDQTAQRLVHLGLGHTRGVGDGVAGGRLGGQQAQVRARLVLGESQLGQAIRDRLETVGHACSPVSGPAPQAGVILQSLRP